MVSVASLLNPFKDEGYQQQDSYSVSYTPPSTPLTDMGSPATHPTKKMKISKDGAIFQERKVQGIVRYPPWEDYDTSTKAELSKFSMQPRLGTLHRYPRRIPYNSDKKSFSEKTGRDAFEVFHYEFKPSPNEKEQVVMWDYNIGLVRMTAFFKSCGHAKTIPSKVINSNPGLKDISHSITGGAIVAQGYWLPFKVAKAVAATFCYRIRYALVPIFGPDFIHTCLKPNEDGYQRMIIDQRIVQESAIECLGYKQATVRETAEAQSRTTPDSTHNTPCSNDSCSSSSVWKQRSSSKFPMHKQRLDFGAITRGRNGGYRTSGVESYRHYLPSPQSPYTWSPSHELRSDRNTTSPCSSSPKSGSSRRTEDYYSKYHCNISNLTTKPSTGVDKIRAYGEFHPPSPPPGSPETHCSSNTTSSSSSADDDSDISPKTKPCKLRLSRARRGALMQLVDSTKATRSSDAGAIAAADLVELADIAATAVPATIESPATAESSTLEVCREPTAEEVRAAYALMQLAYADAMIKADGKGPRKRRASN